MLGMKRSTKRKEVIRNKTGNWSYMGSEGETGARVWIYSSISVAGENCANAEGEGHAKKRLWRKMVRSFFFLNVLKFEEFLQASK